MGATDFNVPFKSYLAALCAGLDIPIFYQEDDHAEIKIHEDINLIGYDETNKLQWLTDISFADFQTNSSDIKKYISENISRLKPIVEKEKILGLAAISTKIQNQEQDFLSIETVGGLAYSVHYRDGEQFIGYMDYTPKSARREKNHFTASDDGIKTWAQNQLNELMTLNLSPIEKYISSSALCHFKSDPIQLAQILTIYEEKIEFLSFKQLAELSSKIGIAFLSMCNIEHMETYHNYSALDGHALIKPLLNSSFLSLKLVDGKPENNNSILDCLYRAIESEGYTPILRKCDLEIRNSFGIKMSAIILSSNK